MRRAFAFASVEQFIVAILGFVSVFVVARLLTPEEIGISAIGVGIGTIVFTAKEFVSSEFLIQQRTLTRADVGTAVTLAGVVNLAVAAVLWIASGWVAQGYDQPGLGAFLEVMCLAALFETLTTPFQALLRREIAFALLARVNIASAAVTAAVTILCASMGMSFMSIAWGQMAGALVRAACAVALRPDIVTAGMSFAGWRNVLSFGGVKGTTTIIDRIYEAMPQLILGRVMPVAAVGYYNRANLLCGIPDRLMMSAVFSFTFPALAARIRAGGDAKSAYLQAQSYISVLFCPAVAFVALIAGPLVRGALGAGWEAVTPIVRILAMASVFWFPIIVTQPTLFALGANRSALAASLTGRGAGMLILGSASFLGLTALALSQFVAIPFYAFVSLRAVRRHLGFTWGEFGRVALHSGAVLACTFLGPVALIVASGAGLAFGMWQALACAGLAFVGWLGGVILLRHPILTELNILSHHALGMVRKTA
ncbi:oligosaccharide flippase family protein (plasmid) [Salipiger sp. H15]|uniref:Oligosaccharide flippase family protein n=1 Tax=Alloyangia sp. H15 TaxID=3029062 RepID=A0AAU8ATI7_9RHOB